MPFIHHSPYKFNSSSSKQMHSSSKWKHANRARSGVDLARSDGKQRAASQQRKRSGGSIPSPDSSTATSGSHADASRHHPAGRAARLMPIPPAAVLLREGAPMQMTASRQRKRSRVPLPSPDSTTASSGSYANASRHHPADRAARLMETSKPQSAVLKREGPGSITRRPASRHRQRNRGSLVPPVQRRRMDQDQKQGEEGWGGAGREGRCLLGWGSGVSGGARWGG